MSTCPGSTKVGSEDPDVPSSRGPLCLGTSHSSWGVDGSDERVRDISPWTRCRGPTPLRPLCGGRSVSGTTSRVRSCQEGSVHLVRLGVEEETYETVQEAGDQF